MTSPALFLAGIRIRRRLKSYLGVAVLLGLTAGLNLIILDAVGKPLKIQNFEPSGTFDGRFIDQDRFTPLQGRLADRTRLDAMSSTSGPRAAVLYGRAVRRLNPGEALRSQG